jgi:hypothetical protein
MRASRPPVSDTGTPERDAHLRSPDFFDVEKFPVLRYQSRRIEKIADRVGGEAPARLVTGDYSVQTSPETLIRGEAGIEEVSATMKLRCAIPVSSRRRRGRAQGWLYLGLEACFAGVFPRRLRHDVSPSRSRRARHHASNFGDVSQIALECAAFDGPRDHAKQENVQGQAQEQRAGDHAFASHAAYGVRNSV